MTKSRRVAWVVVGLIVLALIGGGIWWYIRQNTGDKLLARAQVAMRAKNFDKANSLAGDYIAKYPDNWRGYFLRAQVYMTQGKFAEARAPLADANSRDPGNVSLAIMMAETYSSPALRTLGSLGNADNARKVQAFSEAAEALKKANEVLLTFKTPDPKGALNIDEKLAMNNYRMGLSLQAVAALLEEDARIAEASRNMDTATKKRERSQYEQGRARKVFAEAIKGLLAIIKKDPARAEAAEVLVTLCLANLDENPRNGEDADPGARALAEEATAALAKAREAMKNPNTAPPGAVAMLATHDLRSSSMNTKAGKDKIDEIVERLEGVLKANPKDPQLKIVLGRIAFMQATFKGSDKSAKLEYAKRLAEEVLEGSPRNSGARLLHAEVMLSLADKADQANKAKKHDKGAMEKEKKEKVDPLYAQAEKELFALKSDEPRNAQAHFYYAYAAEKTDKTELARDAMRTVIMLQEKAREGGRGYRPEQWRHFTQARNQLVKQLLQQGFYKQAFTDAQSLYHDYPRDPEALTLFVQAARGTDQRELARETLNKAWKTALTEVGKTDPNKPGQALDPLPVRLMAVTEGFLSLGDKADTEKADQVLDDLLSRDAQAKADNPAKARTSAESLAVAKALIRKRRSAEAEILLLNERANSPDDPETCFILANFYKATNRDLQAEELYRKAVSLDDKYEPSYRLVLAGMFVAFGDLNEAKGVLTPIVASSEQAELLQLRIQGLRGEPIDEGALKFLRRADAGKRYGAQLAHIYLAAKMPEKCRDLCLAGLKTNPNDTAFHTPLAIAYLDLGRRDDCIETWKAAIQAQPHQLPFYQQIVPHLILKHDPNATTSQPSKYIKITQKEMAERIGLASAEMKGIPGARPELVDLAIAGAYERIRLYDSAAEVLAEVTANSTASPGIGYRAQLQLGRVLALGGKPEEAIKKLDDLIVANEGVYKTRAMYEKAELLALMRRKDDAAETLKALRQEAGKNKHQEAALQETALLQVKLGLHEEAEATCDEMEKLFPSSPRSFTIRANILARKGELDQTAKLYEEAISRQPTDFDLYRRLAAVLDAQGKHKAALAALERLESFGRAGMAAGLFDQARLLSMWGLHAEAVRRLDKLLGMENDPAPAVQLALANAFAKLGQKDQAKVALARISEYSREYVPAQLMLADLADGAGDRLAAVRNLASRKPGNESILIYEMTLLLGDKKPAEALMAFDRYQAPTKPGSPLPVKAASLALRAAIRAGDSTRMKQVSRTLANGTNDPQLRLAMALLAMHDEPEASGKALAEPSVYPTMLRLCLASRSGDANEARKCADSLSKIDAALAKLPRPTRIPSNLMFLCGLLANDDSMTKAALAKLGSGIPAQAAREMMSGKPGQARSDAETIKFIKAGIARELGIPELAGAWAMEALKVRATCQWAAMELSLTGPSPEELKQASSLLRPEDCDLAKLLRAMVLQQDGQYKQAAEVYAALAGKAGDNSASYLLDQALALESAGQLPEALTLYRKILQKSADPRAANNAACIVMQLSPNDKAQLAEAKQWMDAALAALPEPALADTAGWLAHLQGRDADALPLLRRAIRGLPDSPDVHYHLGLIETAVGDADMGRLHLAAAVELGNDMRAADKPMPQSTAKAVKLAAEALAAAKNPK